MSKKHLKEFQASGEDSSVADPIETGPKKRMADAIEPAEPKSEDEAEAEDMFDAEGKMQKAPPRMADKTDSQEDMTAAVKEAFGDAVDEATLKKLSTVFEAAVLEKVSSIEEGLIEKYEAVTAEVTSEIYENMVNEIDSYMDVVVNEWLEENKLAIETGIQHTVAESFMSGLADLLKEHNIKVDEEAVDVTERLADYAADLEEQLNVALEENKKLVEDTNKIEVAALIDEACEGMSVVDARRLQKLAENISYNDTDELVEKLEDLKESYFSMTKDSLKANKRNFADSLNEEVDVTEDETTKILDPRMAAYVAAARTDGHKSTV